MRRRRVSLQGIISWMPGATALGCTLLDLSIDGARVTLHRDCSLPMAFFLINVQDRCVYHARIAWRKDKMVGLQFLSVRALSSISEPELAFLKSIWQQSAMN
jgi:hypothetical protein